MSTVAPVQDSSNSIVPMTIASRERVEQALVLSSRRERRRTANIEILSRFFFSFNVVTSSSEVHFGFCRSLSIFNKLFSLLTLDSSAVRLAWIVDFGVRESFVRKMTENRKT